LSIASLSITLILSNLSLLFITRLIKVGESFPSIPSNESNSSKSSELPNILDIDPTLSSEEFILLNNSFIDESRVCSTTYVSFNSVLSGLFGSFTITYICFAVTL
jgi:hypothetical protein